MGIGKSVVTGGAAATWLLASGLAAAQTPQAQPPRGPEPVEVVGDCGFVPMRLLDNIPVVEVHIDGSGPYRFAIDTGASGHGRVSAKLAESLGLAVVGEVRAAAPGGAVTTRRLFAAEAITLGGLSFRNVELAEGATTRGPDAQWDGILGYDVFRALTLTIDYGNGVAGASRAPLAKGAALDAATRIASVPVEIAGRRFKVDLDTGNGAGALFLPETEARALPLTGVPVERGKARTSFGEFSIMEAPLNGPVTLDGVALAIPAVAWPPARGGGNLGSRAFEGRVLRVDRAGGRVSVEASGKPPTCPQPRT